MVKTPTRSGKLAPIYEGPYTVIRRAQGGSYVLQDGTGALMACDYTPSELKLISQDDFVPANELYESHAIVEHKCSPGNPTEVQAICFLNEILLPYDPLNDTLFKARPMSTSQAYRDMVKRITNYLPAYHLFVEKLKTKGYEVIGYARKSVGPEDSDTRVRLLQSMIDKLKERSLKSKVFISTSSSASQLFSERDAVKNSEIPRKLVGVEGTTQDLISYLATTEKDICVVSLDFAGLSTNSVDVRNLIRQLTNQTRIASV
ncbi:hypothetical protein DFQ30_006471 [Apophysomyces sp. BC1015]|nr:hypothetical protein DFQ30_006471 [Apophysomyces sp. BC1015]